MNNETTCGRCGMPGTITKEGYILDVCQYCGALIFRGGLTEIDESKYINWRKREEN